MSEEATNGLTVVPAAQTENFNKPQDSLAMLPRIGRLSPLTRKLFNVLAKATQEQSIQVKARHGGIVPSTHLFKMPLIDMIKQVEPNTNSFTVAKDRLEEMVNTKLVFQSPVKGAKGWEAMHLLSHVGIKIDPQLGQYVAEWAFPPLLVPLFTEVGLYTPLNIALLAELKTYSAIALYEICTKYKTNPSGSTGKLDVDWWMSALSESPSKIDPLTEKEKKRNWAHFKDKQLKNAIREINEKTDLIVDLIDIKMGKKITHAQFSVRRKNIAGVDTSVKLSPGLAEKVANLGLRNPEILALKKSGYSEEVLSIGLIKLGERLARDDLTPVASKIAYLRRVLVELGEQVGESIIKTTAKPKFDIDNHIASSQSTDQDIPLVKTYKQERSKEIEDTLRAMPKEVQRLWANKAKDHLLNNEKFTPGMSRYFLSDDWFSARLFLLEMINVYGKENIGENWSIEKKGEVK